MERRNLKIKTLVNEGTETYVPYMYSPVGFGCHVCTFYYMKGNKHMCNNLDYVKYKGSEELTDNMGNPIKDPSKWCSNWFKPKT